MVDFSKPTVREQIMEAIKDSFVAIKEGQPTTDPYAFTFDIVQRAELTANTKGKKFIAGIFDDDESKQPDTDPVKRATIRVNIELLVYISKTTNEKAATLLNLILGETERRLMEDHTWGNLAIETSIIGSESTIKGRYTGYAEATLFVEIGYRHRNTDPRQII